MTLERSDTVNAVEETVCTEEQSGRGGFYAWYVVGFLTIAATVSIIDRQILALMIGPVKRDLGVSDTMMGLLGGLAFTMFYTVLTLPAAWLSDRSNRRRMIGCGIFFWSLATVGCGLAANYGQLFLARASVGLGEAVLGPASASMISDYFDRKRLPLALGVNAAAPFIGVGLANAGGGYLVQWLEARPEIRLPIMGDLYSWQVMFLVVGLPGLLLALMTLTVREPVRKGRLVDTRPGMPLAEVVRFFLGIRHYVGWQCAGFTALAIQGWAMFYWVVEFFLREHGASRGEVGLQYGLIALVIGASGGVFAGVCASRMMAAGKPDATLRLVIFSSLCLSVLSPIAFLVPDYATSMVLIGVVTFFMGWPPGLGYAAIQFVVPNELKGQSLALFAVVVNFLSYTLGPLLGGLISDHVFGGRSLGHTLALMAAVSYPVGALCVWRCLVHFRSALNKAEAWAAD